MTSGATDSLRRLVQRPVFLLFLAFVLFCLAGVVLGPSGDRQERLERDGVKVIGVVTRTRDPIRGPNSVTYHYDVGGRQYSGHVLGSDYYEVGEQVTVYADPRRPSSSTLEGEQPQSTLGFVALALLFGGVAVLVVVAATLTWRNWRTRRGQRSAQE